MNPFDLILPLLGWLIVVVLCLFVSAFVVVVIATLVQQLRKSFGKGKS